METDNWIPEQKGAQFLRPRSNWTSPDYPELFKPIGDPVDPRLGTRLVPVSSRGTADTDRSDYIITDLYRQAAGDSNDTLDVLEVGGRRIRCNQPGEIGGADAEGCGCVRLAATAIDCMRTSTVVAQDSLDAPGAVHHGHRYPESIPAALHDSALGSLFSQGKRYLPLIQHTLRSCRCRRTHC